MKRLIAISLFFLLPLLAVDPRVLTPSEVGTGWFSTTIAQGAATSELISIQGITVVDIELPVVDAANITFRISKDNVTWTNLYDDLGLEVTVQAGDGSAARTIKLDPAKLWGARYIQIRLGTAATPVTQSAARTLKIGVRQ